MRSALPLVLGCFALACSSSAATPGGSSSSSSSSGSGGSTSSGAGGSGGASNVVGGSRPVTVQVPSAYDPKKPAPLLLLLHGYSVDGQVEDIYLGLTAWADKNGYLYAHPDGTIDSQGNYFWNATDACCNYDGSTVDDSGYLSSVITEIEARWSVDPKRVYLMGHSNGGFMSYRMACDHADQIAAIVSLAGAMWEDTSKCQPTAPVSVLEIHGTADTEVVYDGAPAMPGPGNGAYPGAETSVKDWATLDGCALTPDTSSPPLDLDTVLPGAETTVETYATSCKSGGSATLWTIQGGSHVPNVGDTFRQDVFAFLAAHPKP